MLALDEGTRFQVLAPVIRGRKGEYVDLFRQLQTQGFSRARVDGETHSLSEPPTLDKQKKHTIEVVVDRLAVKQSAKRGSPTRSRPRSGSQAGSCVLDFVDLPANDPGREQRFSEKMACPNDHPLDTDELEPRSFSFNSPFGACPDCHGLGTRMIVDPELVVPDDEKSLERRRDLALVGDPRVRLLRAAARRAGRRAGLLDVDTVGQDPDRGPASRSWAATRASCMSGTRTATAVSAPTTPSSRA